MKDSFPMELLFRPGKAFRGIAEGGTGWGWPLAAPALSSAASALLFKLLPAEYLTESFEGFTFTRDGGYAFYFAASLAGALGMTLFLCALLSALARFLGSGRLALRLPAAALAVAACGFLAAAMHGASGGPRAFGLAAAAAAALFAAAAGYAGRERYPALLKASLAVFLLALAGDLAAGAAALAGSPGAYTAAEYLFSLLSLYWTARAAAAVLGVPGARAAAAVVLAALGGMAFVFLLLNLGLLPPALFEALLLV